MVSALTEGKRAKKKKKVSKEISKIFIFCYEYCEILELGQEWGCFS